MKPLTLPELFDKLKDLDEITILEILCIDSEQLVEAFKDKIEEMADKLEQLLDDDFLENE